MTNQEAIEFGAASARMAIDTRGEWESLQYSLDVYRENVRETLKDCDSAQHEEDAFRAFDAAVAGVK